MNKFFFLGLRLGLTFPLTFPLKKLSFPLTLTLSLLFANAPCYSQTVIGTPGLMNIPTAEVRKGCTFDGGISLVQPQLLPDHMDYYTAVYYINFSPFSFFDLTLRETLLRTPKSEYDPTMGFHQQDRSLTLRVQPLREKEGKWWPSVLIGSNDFFSPHGISHYAAVYGVVTKTLPVKGFGKFSATLGYSHPIFSGTLYNGVFGGASFSPAFAPMARIMAEYDTRGVNVGIGAQFWRHMNVTCFTREFKGFSATISYQYTITFKR